ncbi:MAG TPA: phosphotransferase [Streptosporangiaceae bacterium]|nr:phosphotransferase [Streptosporangiaceae bacterium]
MTVERPPADFGLLAGLTRATFGTGQRLLGLERIEDATKKGVYRATFDDGFSAVIYVWHPSENYWPGAEVPSDHADPFSPASGLDLFRAAHTRLTDLGVRTPKLYLADAGHEHYPADVAVVEDLTGPTLEEVLAQQPDRALPVMGQFSRAIQAMHADKATRFGKLPHVSNGGTSHGSSCEQVVLDRGLADLAEASARVSQISGARERLEDALRERAAGLSPRSEYGLIHGELDPGHVLLDDEGRPAIIDIEGLMYFDVEWEHAFLKLRLDDDYETLRVPGLDQRRLDFYTLAYHLDLVAGPLRLLNGDFPRPEAMMEIVESNARAALRAATGQAPQVVTVLGGAAAT